MAKTKKSPNQNLADYLLNYQIPFSRVNFQKSGYRFTEADIKEIKAHYLSGGGTIPKAPIAAPPEASLEAGRAWSLLVELPKEDVRPRRKRFLGLF